LPFSGLYKLSLGITLVFIERINTYGDERLWQI